MSLQVKNIRLSVSLRSEDYDEVMRLAERYDVSAAWLGRQAIVEFLEKYRDAQSLLPLGLKRTPQGER